MKELRTNRLGSIAKSLAILMVALIGLINGNTLPVITHSTIVVDARESNSDESSRTSSGRNPDTRATSRSTAPGSSPVSALSKPDESLAQVSAPGTNGKIAFTRSLNISEVHLMNADGSNRINLTNSQGFDGSPAWSPDGSKVAFVSNRDGNREIYVMNADGSNLTQLTSNPVLNGQPLNDQPTWSPDGSRIAFMKAQFDIFSDQGSFAIYVMNADGSNLTQLTNLRFAFDSDPAWSPDGSRVAFTRSYNNNAEVYVVNADGSNLTRLTNSPWADNTPAWSPGGQKIAFTSERDGNAEIYVMNADGSGQTRLTNSPQFDGLPAWAPNSTRIAFASSRDGNDEIYVMNADGGNPTRITNEPASDRDPAWSPDGVRIAFATYQFFNEEIYVMNGDGSSQLNLTNHPTREFHPAWSPDGSRIAFASDRDGNFEIYLMNADGSNQTRLTDRPAEDFSPDWSPDGTRIVFASNDGIYVMNADGSNQTRLIDRGFFDGTPAWSPDGSRIAFMHNAQICVMNANGGNLTCLTTATLWEYQGDPAWSPDGTKISYTAIPIFSDQVTSADEIFVMDAAGGNIANLTGTHHVIDSGSAWSPDGARIAFSSYRDGNNEIYVMNADGGFPTRLTTNLDANNVDPDWHALATPINSIDDAQFFVRQHYLDFLNREPDAPGLAHWVSEITSCNDSSRRLPGESLALCVERKRTNTSAAFFLSPEFQYTGYFVYRLYKGSLIQNGAGRVPTYQEFLRDVRQVAAAIIQNNQLSATAIEANKKTFVEEFTKRAEFRNLYDPLSNFDYVERLFQTTGISVSANEKQALVDGLNNQTETRASVLQKVVDGTLVIAEGNQQFTTSYGQAFYEKEFNAAFVLMEYFGYLHRDPDPAGYQHWLDKLNLYPDYIEAEMVKSFITSPEYRARFGQP